MRPFLGGNKREQQSSSFLCASSASTFDTTTTNTTLESSSSSNSDSIFDCRVGIMERDTNNDTSDTNNPLTVQAALTITAALHEVQHELREKSQECSVLQETCHAIAHDFIASERNLLHSQKLIEELEFKLQAVTFQDVNQAVELNNNSVSNTKEEEGSSSSTPSSSSGSNNNKHVKTRKSKSRSKSKTKLRPGESPPPSDTDSSSDSDSSNNSNNKSDRINKSTRSHKKIRFTGSSKSSRNKDLAELQHSARVSSASRKKSRERERQRDKRAKRKQEMERSDKSVGNNKDQDDSNDSDSDDDQEPARPELTPRQSAFIKVMWERDIAERAAHTLVERLQEKQLQCEYLSHRLAQTTCLVKLSYQDQHDIAEDDVAAQLALVPMDDNESVLQACPTGARQAQQAQAQSLSPTATPVLLQAAAPTDTSVSSLLPTTKAPKHLWQAAALVATKWLAVGRSKYGADTQDAANAANGGSGSGNTTSWSHTRCNAYDTAWLMQQDEHNGVATQDQDSSESSSSESSTSDDGSSSSGSSSSTNSSISDDSVDLIESQGTVHVEIGSL